MLLLLPYKLGPLTLPNRVVMAPLTRNRAKGTISGPLNATYYAQRASAGLIVTEGTQVAPLGQGYQETPGIYTDEHVAGWRVVTQAVHEAGGRIFAQLWHVGRVSHSYYHGQQPVAPSEIPPPGKAYTPEGLQPYETPHALTMEEVAEVVGQFAHGARCAQEAGFDGVEIHGANGYLIDQFLQSGTNQRTDRYGGGVENRTRFLREVVEAVADVWQSDRVGVRLSPGGSASGISDECPSETFAYAGEVLNRYGLAYLHVVSNAFGPEEHQVNATDLMREAYEGTLITAGGYSPESAERALQQGRADLVAFGRLWIANPDLVHRIEFGAHLNTPDRDTFYAGGEHGYIDYPTLEEVES